MLILLNVILPVFVVAGLGALAQVRLQLDLRTLSRATFYLFAPALIFDSLATSGIGGAEFGRITAVVLLTTLVLWAVGIFTAKLLRLSGPTQAAFLAAILIMNSGNYGLPVNLFAFGEAGLARASLFFPVTALIASSLGVYLNARGRLSSRQALRRVVGVPLVYAAVLGMAFNLANLTVPEPLEKAIHLLGQASIPSMLLVLGVRLAETIKSRPEALRLPALTAVTILRLLLAPALAWFVATGVGLQALTRDVVVLESAMPTAVMTTILATEFDSDPSFAALCVLITTLASLPTVTILLNLLA